MSGRYQVAQTQLLDARESDGVARFQLGNGMKSFLIVQQNAYPGRAQEFNDWYTNVHIRDLMRMEGSIAVQRFALAPNQLTLRGRSVACQMQYFTVYELESHRQMIDAQRRDAFTDRLLVSNSGDLRDVFVYFFDPVHLTSDWSVEAGLRLGRDVFLCQVRIKQEDERRFEEWFQRTHVTTLGGRSGYGSISLLRIAREQMAVVGVPCQYTHVVLYGLTDLTSAILSWQQMHEGDSEGDLSIQVPYPTITAYTQVIPRLLASSVRSPTQEAADAERRTRSSLEPSRLWSEEELKRYHQTAVDQTVVPGSSTGMFESG